MKKLLLLLFSVFVFIFNTNATTHTITAADFTFSPATITINLGDTIKWVLSAGTHTTTSETIPAGAATWNANLKTGSTTFVYVPKVAGVYNYQCNFHVSMGMTGIFTVVAGCAPVTVQIKAGAAASFCKGDSVSLTSTITGAVSSYQWYLNAGAISGQTKSSVIAKASGSYTVRVSSSCGSKDTSNIIVVKSNALPPAAITPSGSVNLCLGDSTLLTAGNTGSEFIFQWSRNNAAISDATKKTYEATKAGNYKVLVTNNKTGCMKSSPATKIVTMSCLTNNATNKSAITSDKLKIYPDPVAQKLTLSINATALHGTLQVNVYNASGEKIKNITAVKNENNFQQDIDMTGFAPGLYFVQVSDGKTVMTQKFVKK